MQDYLLIGSVLKPQGIRGESKIKSFAADAESFRRWKTLYRLQDGEYLPVSAKVVRIQDDFVFSVLDGAVDANAAEKLRGCDLYIRREDAAEPEENGNLIADLVGCRAVNEAGEELGVLTDVLQSGPVDTWSFTSPSGAWMAPALLSVFPRVDTAAGVISVCSDRLLEVIVRED